MISRMVFSFTIVALYILVCTVAVAEPINGYDSPEMDWGDLAPVASRRSTSLTLYGGIQRGMRLKQEIESPDKYNWLLGVSVNPSIGSRWRLPIEFSLWKWQPGETEKISLRANVSVAFEVLQSRDLTLFVAGGVGIFAPAFPVAIDLGGGIEFHLTESAGLIFGIHTLFHHNADQRPAPKVFASPVFLNLGVNLTHP